MIHILCTDSGEWNKALLQLFLAGIFINCAKLKRSFAHLTTAGTAVRQCLCQCRDSWGKTGVFDAPTHRRLPKEKTRLACNEQHEVRRHLSGSPSGVGEYLREAAATCPLKSTRNERLVRPSLPSPWQRLPLSSLFSILTQRLTFRLEIHRLHSHNYCHLCPITIIHFKQDTDIVSAQTLIWKWGEKSLGPWNNPTETRTNFYKILVFLNSFDNNVKNKKLKK